jgi:hypothetical protein
MDLLTTIGIVTTVVLTEVQHVHSLDRLFFEKENVAR